jgi:hypothetical protein
LYSFVTNSSTIKNGASFSNLSCLSEQCSGELRFAKNNIVNYYY